MKGAVTLGGLVGNSLSVSSSLTLLVSQSGWGSGLTFTVINHLVT